MLEEPRDGRGLFGLGDSRESPGDSLMFSSKGAMGPHSVLRFYQGVCC